MFSSTAGDRSAFFFTSSSVARSVNASTPLRR